MALSGSVTLVSSSVAPSLVNKTLAKRKEDLEQKRNTYVPCAVGLNYKDFS